MFNFKIGRRPKKTHIVRGDSILEVVIATAILASLLIATFDILQRALDTNINVKNRLIALNIAREGVEAVRNIRDTNWLKYSGERREKWLCLDLPGANTCNGTITPAQIINANNPDNPNYYTVNYNDTQKRYYLSLASEQSPVDFQNGTDYEEYRLYLTPTVPQRYVHGGAGNDETIFYRQVWLDIENPYDTRSDLGGAPIDDPVLPPVDGFCDDADVTCSRARLRVIVSVFWEEENRTRQITLETNLFDFFGRDDY